MGPPEVYYESSRWPRERLKGFARRGWQDRTTPVRKCANKERNLYALTRRQVLGVMMTMSASACQNDKSSAPEAATSSSSAPKDETILVGLIASLTGKFSALGSEDKKAVELAVEQINATGGLLGKKIVLETRDDQTLPDKSVLAYNDLKALNVAAVIGSAFSNSALATLPFAERDGIPYLSLTPAEEQVQPIKRFGFVIPALSVAFAERYLEYMQAQKITKIAVAHDSKGAYAVSGYNATKSWRRSTASRSSKTRCSSLLPRTSVRSSRTSKVPARKPSCSGALDLPASPSPSSTRQPSRRFRCS